MDPLFWAVILMSVGLGLVMLEVFIPSGGILGFLATCAVFGSIYFSFTKGTGYGMAFVGIALAGMPTALILALKYLPNTPIGRRLLLGVPSEDEVLPEDDPRQTLNELIGRFGTAKSAMLPGGAIVIDNVAYEAVCEAGSVEQGEPVEVVMVRNNRLVVRQAKEIPPSDNPDDVLSRPVDTVGIESLEDPLG
jgi:membrane-bound ClpP family serine protease